MIWFKVRFDFFRHRYAMLRFKIQDESLWEHVYEDTFGGGEERRREKETFHLKKQMAITAESADYPSAQTPFEWDWRAETLLTLKKLSSLRGKYANIPPPPGPPNNPSIKNK